MDMDMGVYDGVYGVEVWFLIPGVRNHIWF